MTTDQNATEQHTDSVCSIRSICNVLVLFFSSVVIVDGNYLDCSIFQVEAYNASAHKQMHQWAIDRSNKNASIKLDTA